MLLGTSIVSVSELCYLPVHNNQSVCTCTSGVKQSVCVTVWKYSGTSLLRPSELWTPPLYGRLTKVPNGQP